MGSLSLAEHPTLTPMSFTPMSFTGVLGSLPFLLLLFFLPLLSFFIRSQRNKGKIPPGPTKLPIVGNLHQLGELPHRSLWRLSQKYGPLMYLRLGCIPTIVASSADTAREILKTHDIACCSRPLLTSTTRLSYGCSDVVFAPYGEDWREMRKLCILELFTVKKVQSFRPIREEEIEQMISSISSQSMSGSGLVNLSEVMFSLSNNITCRTALGRSYQGSRFNEILKEAQALSCAFFFSDYLPMIGWVDKLNGLQERLERNFRNLDRFYQQVIDEHLDPTRPKHDEQDEDTVDTLLRIRKEASRFTENHVKGVLMNIFIAGTDTTSASVEWAMTELMRNPRVMRKAQDELRSFIGRKGKVEESDLDHLHYLKSVVKEVMRLHPPAPLLLPRETMSSCTIDGYDIPPRTRVLINAWAIGREAGCWENSEEFYPERFLNNTIDVKGHDFQLIPFGAGRRICPAVNVGTLIVELALANLLYSFDWKLPSGVRKEDICMDEATGTAVHRKYALSLACIKFRR